MSEFDDSPRWGSSESPGSPPPGWYQDPEQPGAQRYWDGSGWTENRSVAPQAGVPAGYAPAGPKTSGLAIASMVCGIVWMVGITSILAIVFAVVSKRQIRESNGWLTGGGFATAGLVLGIIGVIGAIIYVLAIIVLAEGGDATITFYE